jgi:uncharacterized protein DUF6081
MDGRAGMTGRQRMVAAVVAATATLVWAGGVAVADEASASTGEVLFHDDFAAGFDKTDTWLLGKSSTPTAELPEGDGVISVDRKGITVVPTGRNPRTGKPAFAATADQQAAGFGGGTGDHLKWVAQPRKSSANGFPIPDTGAMTCTSKVQVKVDGIDRHPFGRAVADPQSDPRLASATMITVDHATHTVFNFTVTNTEIHAIYERLPVDSGAYAAFHYSIPVAKRTPGRTEKLQIRFDQGGKRVSWLVDGRKVLSTDRIGTRAFDRKYLRIDHGGPEETVVARNVQCGLGTGNLLDGGGGVKDSYQGGLVRLEDSPDFYYSPSAGAPTAQTFLDDASRESNRLFGQGVTLKVNSFDMRYER